MSRMIQNTKVEKVNVCDLNAGDHIYMRKREGLGFFRGVVLKDLGIYKVCEMDPAFGGHSCDGHVRSMHGWWLTTREEDWDYDVHKVIDGSVLDIEEVWV